MHFSVIIPAYNASATLTETVESLLAQTFGDWEAIIVDDGSHDDTVAIAKRFAKSDARIRTVSQPHQGVCAVRNTGISLARYEWLLFLDADDWLVPRALERFADKLAACPDLDLIHCGWTRATANGALFGEEYCPQEKELFPLFAKNCGFAIHACVVRRALVIAVGSFDTSLRLCEDWDLWLRVLRAGARCGMICEVLAHYRIRSGSASFDGTQMLSDGLRVLALGHAPDPRVLRPSPAYANGLPLEKLLAAKFLYACWTAGLMIGQVQDARPLLALLDTEPCLDLEPAVLAEAIFSAAHLSPDQSLTVWDTLWPKVETFVTAFLLTLERKAQTPELARRVQRMLERLIIEHSQLPRPLTIGTTHAVQLDAAQAIPDLSVPCEVDRVHCFVDFAGHALGTIVLPACDGQVRGAVLADAVAAEFAWPILGQFFEHTVYRTLTSRQEEPESLSLWRGPVCLAEALPKAGPEFRSHIHDQCGWTIFLQEVWARPDWPSARFYDSQQREQEVAPRRQIDEGWVVVEVSQEVLDIETTAPVLNVVLTVGGVALGVVPLPVTNHFVSAQEIRVNILMASGFELCRAAVREGLLGRPLTEATSLQTRLAEAALARRSGADPTPEESVSQMLTISGTPCGIGYAPALVPGSARVLNQVVADGSSSLILGRREPATIGTSASRRAMFPVATAPLLLAAVFITGEPALLTASLGEQPKQIEYKPELLWSSLRRPQTVGNGGKVAARSAGVLRSPNRAYFEQFFADQVDPWKYTSPYEQVKYEQTLSLLPEGRIEHALELACAEGHFTVQLAPRVEHLTAADISQVALERAAERCANWQNVSFLRLDFMEEPLPGHFSLIVCCEVLYYVGGRAELQTIAEKLAEALTPGGYLLMAHVNAVVDEPDHAGFDWDVHFGAKTIGETFSTISSLRLVKELHTPLYRIQLFQHDPNSSSPDLEPERITFSVQPTSLLPEVAAHVLWNGGKVQSPPPQPLTIQRLPILMYHRVAPAGSLLTRRWRVTPEAFEEQLDYLSSAGYYSISLEEWRLTKEEKKPLPGRAVLITFDDGYQDFFTYAWPLLKRYGFSATVFLVTKEIGGTNAWDAFHGETVLLLNWSEIRQLQKEGVEFGSHSAGHRPLTALTPAEIVYEGMHSRAILENVLGTPVRAFAYPYGDTDQMVQHLIGACGFSFGLSCHPGLSRIQDSLLALPRVEVVGAEGLREFVVKLHP